MDRGIAEEIARAGGTSVSKLGLRFDRVVVRILDDLSRFTERAAPANRCVLVTISAPIRLPARTERVLEQEIDALLPGRLASTDQAADVHGNKVRLRLVDSPSKRPQRLIGFVHNPDIDATRLLDLAEQWLSPDL